MLALIERLLRLLIVWGLIIVVESAHGALRRVILPHELGMVSRVGATVIGCVIVFICAHAMRDFLRARTVRDALGVGIGWALCTLAFEVGLGRLLHLSWAKIASEYDPTQGGFMGLGLLFMILTPLLVRRRSWRRR